MRPHSRRLFLAGVWAVLMLVAGWAPPALADTDLQTVADSIDEAGYFVDSHAKYFHSDRALESLRSAQEGTAPTYVAVLSAKMGPERVIAGLKGLMHRDGTYVVLSGTRLRVASTTVSAATIKAAYTKALKAEPKRPDLALVRFLRLLPRAVVPPPVSTDPATLADAQHKNSAAAKKESGGSLITGVIGILVVAALLGGGFLLFRHFDLASRMPGRAKGRSPKADTPPPAPVQAAEPPAPPAPDSRSQPPRTQANRWRP